VATAATALAICPLALALAPYLSADTDMPRSGAERRRRA